jgi:hypothetical protein
MGPTTESSGENVPEMGLSTEGFFSVAARLDDH